MVTPQRSRAALDDDDSNLYDPKYYPRKVVRDGKGIRVPIFLTDGRPDWTPPSRPALVDYARDASRNYYYQPHFYVGDSDPPALAAERSYLERSAHLRDAWRTMGGGTGGAPHTTAPAADEPGESARDAYIKRTSNAWRTPPGRDPDDDDADAIERQREAWAKPGAKPGATPSNNAAGGKTMLPAWPGAPGIGDAAALADRDAAYAAYVADISNAWRRR